MSDPQESCRHCGAQVAASSRFCSACGEPLGQAAAQKPPRAIKQGWLVVGATKRYSLLDDAIRLGRSSSGNDIVVDDPRSSRYHARIEPQQDGLLLTDQGSSNGTYVNGKRIMQPTLLSHGDTFSIGRTTFTVQHEGDVPPLPAAAPAAPSGANIAKKKGRPPLVVVGTIGVVLAVIIVGAMGWGAISFWDSAQQEYASSEGVSPAAAPTSVETAPDPSVSPTSSVPPAQIDLGYQPEETVVASANGVPATDKQGVSLRVEADAVAEAPGVEMVRSTGSGALATELEKLFTIETSFYSVAVQGEQDGQGRAELTFPAPDPRSRVALIIDQQYVALIDAPPEKGVLRARALLGAAVPTSDYLVGTLAAKGDVTYVVLTPRAGSAQHINWLRPAVAHAEQSSVRDCLRVADNPYSTTAVAIPGCRKNPSSTVNVHWPTSSGFTAAQADQLIAVVEEGMRSYNGLNLTAAKLSVLSPVNIIIEKGTGSPYYSPKSGTIYMPLNSAKNIGTIDTKLDLLHEMAHWIQDEEYIMNYAALSHPKSWWLEVAAENMVFLIEPQGLEHNLKTYGEATGNDTYTFGFQMAPYLWDSNEEARYIHAQLLKVNMCDSPACALSQQQFIAAINAGTYPFEGADVQAKVSANLDDYARYLLGSAPTRANSAIPISGRARRGHGVGQYIHVQRAQNNDLKLSNNGYKPQVSLVSTGPSMAACKVNAQIAKDGVYPLRVSSGPASPLYDADMNKLEAGLPVMITISPGAELLYRLGDDAPAQHDGKSELVLGPVHATMGDPVVRVVGVGRARSTTFDAMISPLDLRGDWVFKAGRTLSYNDTCSSTTEDESSDFDVMKYNQFIANGMSQAYATVGTYNVTSSPGQLRWESQGGALPSEFSLLLHDYEATTTVAHDHIEATSQFVLEDRSTSQSTLPLPHPPAASNAAPALLLLPPAGLALLATRVRRRRLLLATGVLMVMTLLAGCMYISGGTFQTTFTFEELAYAGQGAPPEAPLWKLGGGTATSNATITIESCEDILEECEQTVTTRCNITTEFEVTAEIYKDGVLQDAENIPELSPD